MSQPPDYTPPGPGDPSHPRILGPKTLIVAAVVGVACFLAGLALGSTAKVSSDVTNGVKQFETTISTETPKSWNHNGVFCWATGNGVGCSLYRSRKTVIVNQSQIIVGSGKRAIFFTPAH